MQRVPDNTLLQEANFPKKLNFFYLPSLSDGSSLQSARKVRCNV